MYTRLREYLWENYRNRIFTKDHVISALFRFSRNIRDGLFSNRCGTLSDYYVLVGEGVIDEERFDRVLVQYLRDGKDFSTGGFWEKAQRPQKFR